MWHSRTLWTYNNRAYSGLLQPQKGLYKRFSFSDFYAFSSNFLSPFNCCLSFVLSNYFLKHYCVSQHQTTSLVFVSFKSQFLNMKPFFLLFFSPRHHFKTWMNGMMFSGFQHAFPIAELGLFRSLAVLLLSAKGDVISFSFQTCNQLSLGLW